jgi:uncharacterized phiE125 gp8 family phage protein
MLGSSRFVGVLDGAIEPVTLARVKEQLKVDSSADDDLITAFISGVRRECENYLFTALINQTRVAFFPCFGELNLMGPHIEIASIVYRDTEGVEVTLADTEYRVVADVVTKILPIADWPVTKYEEGAVKVTFTCGPDAGEISPMVVNAMLLKITDMYDNRANPTRAKATLADNMLGLERVQIFG